MPQNEPTPVTVHNNRAAEEHVLLRKWFTVKSIDASGLAYAVWHLANLLSVHTGGRYRLALLKDGEEVEPRDLGDDRAVPSVIIQDEPSA